MNTTVGALRNMFLNEGSSAARGLALTKSSVTPLMNSGESTTRISHDWRFCPLGALMPHSRIVFMVSRPTATG